VVPHLACDRCYGWRVCCLQGLNERQLPTLPPGRFHIWPLGLLHRVFDLAQSAVKVAGGVDTNVSRGSPRR